MIQNVVNNDVNNSMALTTDEDEDEDEIEQRETNTMERHNNTHIQCMVSYSV